MADGRPSAESARLNPIRRYAPLLLAAIPLAVAVAYLVVWPRPHWIAWIDTEADYLYGARLIADGMPLDRTEHPGTLAYLVLAVPTALLYRGTDDTDLVLDVARWVVAVVTALSIAGAFRLHRAGPWAPPGDDEAPHRTWTLVLAVLTGLAWPGTLSYIGLYASDSWLFPVGLLAAVLLTRALRHPDSGWTLAAAGGLGALVGLKFSTIPFVVAGVVALGMVGRPALALGGTFGGFVLTTLPVIDHMPPRLYQLVLERAVRRLASVDLGPALSSVATSFVTLPAAGSVSRLYAYAGVVGSGAPLLPLLIPALCVAFLVGGRNLPPTGRERMQRATIVSVAIGLASLGALTVLKTPRGEVGAALRHLQGASLILPALALWLPPLPSIARRGLLAVAVAAVATSLVQNARQRSERIGQLSTCTERWQSVVDSLERPTAFAPLNIELCSGSRGWHHWGNWMYAQEHYNDELATRFPGFWSLRMGRFGAAFDPSSRP